MTDMQMERLAGEAIGLVPQGIDGRDAFLWLDDPPGTIWVPMSDWHQAMRLVRELRMDLNWSDTDCYVSWFAADYDGIDESKRCEARGEVQHAIVECAAKVRLNRYPSPAATSQPAAPHKE